MTRETTPAKGRYGTGPKGQIWDWTAAWSNFSPMRKVAFYNSTFLVCLLKSILKESKNITFLLTS